MAETYTGAKSALNEIAGHVVSDQKQLLRARTQIGAARVSLEGIPTKYADVITWIDDQATANPAVDLWTELKAEKDQMATDFVALKGTAQSMETDLAGYDP